MAGVRKPAIEHKSNLPVFQVTASKDFPNWSNVTCPRHDCGQTHFVHTKRWRTAYGPIKASKVRIRGRTCPYCGRSALLPGRR